MADYAYLPGAVGHCPSTPDSAALSVTGDIDIRLKVALDSWTPASGPALLSKSVGAGSQRSYGLFLSSGGNLTLIRSVNGTATTNYPASVNTGLAALAVKWVRCTRSATTGTVQYFLSDDGSSWSQLGTDVTGASGDIFDSTASLVVGAGYVGDTQLAGKYYRAQVLNGIDGTVVFDASFADRTSPTFAEGSSNAATVTLNGQFSSGYEPTWLPAEALYGNAAHYGYEMKKLDAPEPAPKTTFPAATGGTTYPVAR